MKKQIAAVSCALLVLGTTPARADFKYSDTTTITGGSLKSMMKAVSIFSKAASQATKPLTTTHYLKGDRLRTDDADGRIQIIDLAGRRFIDIDTQKRTYTVMTFDDMKTALQNATAQLQQKQPDTSAKPGDPKVNMNAKVTVTPGSGTRQIQGMTANEMKVQIDMEFQATAQKDGQTNGQQPGDPNQTASGTVSTTVDSWVSPDVPGYGELAEFYKRMAKEINWVPPSNFRMDPRVSQSMDELQKNQGAYKGMPLLQYMTMSMVAQGTDGTTTTASAPPPPANSSSSSSGPPTSISGAVTKGLGGLFAKKKKDDPPPPDANSSNPPPPSTPGSLMEMTIETNNISNSGLDASLFDIPAGFTQIQADPNQTLGQRKK
jgi:hypothetical protein